MKLELTVYICIAVVVLATSGSERLKTLQLVLQDSQVVASRGRMTSATLIVRNTVVAAARGQIRHTIRHSHTISGTCHFQVMRTSIAQLHANEH